MARAEETYQILSAYTNELYLTMPYAMTQVRGLAMPPVQRRTSRAPFQDGTTHLGQSLGPRFLDVILHLRGCDRQDLWNKRRDVLNLLNPQLGDLIFRVNFRDNTKLELTPVRYDSVFEMGTDGQRGSTAQAVAMRLVSNNPTWRDPDLKTASPVLTDENELIFPITFGAGGDLVFGTTKTSGTFTAITLGDWPTFPTIQMLGPLNNPEILNTTTGEKIGLQYPIADGELVEITLEYGTKGVVNDSGDNLNSYLTEDSNFSTFHLDPDPVATGGVNNFEVSATFLGAAPGTFTITWYDRFLAV